MWPSQDPYNLSTVTKFGKYKAVQSPDVICTCKSFYILTLWVFCFSWKNPLLTGQSVILSSGDEGQSSLTSIRGPTEERLDCLD